jgi:hypothetical protein
VLNKSRSGATHQRNNPRARDDEREESEEVTDESGGTDESQDEGDGETVGEADDEDATAQWTDVEPDNKGISQDVAMGDERYEGSASPPNASVSNLWEDYQPSDEQIGGWSTALEYLQHLKNSSWAECDVDDLEQYATPSLTPTFRTP